ncbi:MAG: hypothetical protein ACYTCU_10935, partial [Planctomycetota bacterium]
MPPPEAEDRPQRNEPRSLSGGAAAVTVRRMARPPFHLAFPVHDLAAARTFYGDLLGCPEGRSSERWVDFD